MPTITYYDCPVYTTTKRASGFTSGTMDNWIMDIKLPIGKGGAKREQFWILRGVALLSSLDD